MYRALYRKWRPATFADVIGQESIVTALQSQLLHDKVGHAYIFTGTRGTGKTTCAKIFAKAVNCETRNGANPCCQCSTCKGIETGAVMDVVEIDAASNNGVDNIRDLRDETAYTPSVGLYKVYIIDEVHMLSTAAFNALLKIMEEPPSHVIFILATTEIHKVPATILSRCQRYDFVRIAPQAIAGRLMHVAEQESINLTLDAAELIARLADGAMRDALSILDTCSGVSSEVDADTVRRMAGVTDKTYLFTLSDSIATKDVPAALALIAQLREKSIDIKRLCDELVLHYRNIMLAGVSGGRQLLTGVSADEEERYVAAAQSIGQASAIRAVKAFCTALDKMGKSADARIELELAVFNLCGTDAPPVAYAAPPPAPRAAQAQYAPQAPAQTAPYAAPYNAPAPQAAYAAPPQPYASATASAPVVGASGASASAAVTAVSSPSSASSQGAPQQDLPWRDDPDEAQALQASPPMQVERVIPVPQTEFGTMEVSPELEQRGMPDDPPAFAPNDDAAPPVQEPRSLQQPALEQPSQAAVPTIQSSVPTIAPPTPSEQGDSELRSLEPFAQWPAIIAAMEPKDKMLFVNMRNSKAYFDGKRVRIDGSELFLEYMRRNKYSSGLIREIIEQVTGRQYPIGPYEAPNQPIAEQGPTAEQALAQLEAQGVSVIYHDK